MLNSNDILTFCADAGKIMLENGAETYRVEDTMLRILKSYDLNNAEAFVTTTGVFVSIDSRTIIRRIKERCIHIGKIAKVNALSRKITAKEISFENAKLELENINNLRPYPFYIITFVTGIATLSFTYIFGGNFFDCINSFITGIVLNIVIYTLRKEKVSNFLITLIGGITVSTVCILIYKIGIGNNIDNSIIGSLMPLVPGVGLTNAIRDILEGDFLSGSGRIFDAVIIAVALATGVGFVIGIWIKIFGGF